MKLTKITLLTSLLCLSLNVSAHGNNNNSSKHAVSDKSITHKVESYIKESKVLSKEKITVTTKDGVVNLSGTVDANNQISPIVEYAEALGGVSDVNTDKITVKDSQEPFADAMITAKIKGVLIREKLFGEKDVAALATSVETKDGVVYLTGMVDDPALVKNAIEVIKKSVPGVKEVEYKMNKTVPVSASDTSDNKEVN